MAVYGQMVLTQQGLALYQKAQTGVQLNFTRMQIGGGQLAQGQDPTALTALITPIYYFSINSIASSGNTAYVKGIFENTDINASTYTCEIGLFATDPTDGEILYAYANAGTQGDTIPPISAGPLSKQYQINVALGNATGVTATIPANTYIPTTQIGAANGVPGLDANGLILSANLPKATSSSLGAVKIGTGITADADGTIHTAPVNPSTGSSLGTVELPASAGSPTTPVVPFRAASVQDYKMVDTNLDTIIFFTPVANGNFSVKINCRVETAATNVTIQVTYTNADGARTYTVVNQSLNPGEYMFPAPFFTTYANDQISVNVQAATANQVYVSASIIGE